MKKYKHIFFDLDHTLWDYESNARETLLELHLEHELGKLNIKSDAFIEVYALVNAELWRSYNSGKINKDDLREFRFYKTLGHLGVKDKTLSLQIEDNFLARCPLKPHVLPNSFEVLDYLIENYEMHIITNGFKGSTENKLSNSRLSDYFTKVITSECIGVTKPNTEIFDYALEISGAEKHSSIMIGDNLETDIKGAINTGMDHIYYNPKRKKYKGIETKEISDLIELKELL